jgi:hypothetical protein
MPLDGRLRDALYAEAATVEPDVERRLGVVVGRTERRSSRALGALATAAVALVILVVVVRTVPVDPLAVFQSPAATPTISIPPADAGDRLVGTYRASFDVGDLARSDLTGEWTLILGADSSVAAIAPPGFSATSDAPLDGYLYAIRDDELYINLFARHLERSCVASGSYRWQVADGRLTLEVEADPCEPRAALLTSRSWERLR